MLERIGYDAHWAECVRARDARPGRVVRTDHGLVHVLTDDGPLRAGYGGELLAAVAKDPTGAPCPGDWVVVRDWPQDKHTVAAVLPRRCALTSDCVGLEAGVEPGAPLLANADRAVLVLPVRPAPARAQVAGLLALVEHCGASPVIALSKSDTVDRGALVALARRLGDAVPGVEVVCTSAVDGTGLDRLRDLARGGRTLALVGPGSGGRSWLVRSLVGARRIPTLGLVEPAGVRCAELVLLPGGGAVIDTPALRGPVPARRLHAL